MISKFKELYKLANVGVIARRYFAMNSFDGILTILGIIIGSYFSLLRDPRIVLGASLGAASAMAVSGAFGAYLTETAERKKKMAELEKHTMQSLKKSKLAQAEKFGAFVIAAVDGLSPFIAALLVVTPFFLNIPVQTMYFASVAIAFVMLFLLGIFLGKIAKDNLVISGLKMLVAGLVAGFLGWLLTR